MHRHGRVLKPQIILCKSTTTQFLSPIQIINNLPIHWFEQIEINLFVKLLNIRAIFNNTKKEDYNNKYIYKRLFKIHPS